VSPRGGHREGSGRKAPDGVRKPIQVLLNDSERAEIEAAATAAEKETSTYMRAASLEKARKNNKRKGKKS
jgi:hypothetical protein